jgi:hypothetical protein
VKLPVSYQSFGLSKIEMLHKVPKDLTGAKRDRNGEFIFRNCPREGWRLCLSSPVFFTGSEVQRNRRYCNEMEYKITETIGWFNDII